MRYGPLFRNYIEDYNHTPSTNRCTTLSYKELKQMAKNMYNNVKELCEEYADENPLTNYTRMTKAELPLAVYNALTYLYKY